MKLKTITLFFALLASCSPVGIKHISNKLQVKGHLTLSAGGCCLITENLKRRYEIGQSDFPQDVWDFLKTQKPHIDIRSANNYSFSCEVIAEGFSRVVDNKYTMFSASKILYLGKSQNSFLKLWEHEPIPRPADL